MSDQQSDKPGGWQIRLMPESTSFPLILNECSFYVLTLAMMHIADHDLAAYD